MNNLDYAVQKALEQPYIKHQKRLFAVVLDKKNRVVSQSANSYSKTNTHQKRYGSRIGNPHLCYLHAELGALLRDKNRRGVKLVVARIDSKGNSCLAKPCEACMIAIKEYTNIKSIEFSV